MKYVVIKRGSEYDDERYTLNDGGEPVKVFSNKPDAEVHARNADLEAFKGLELRDYGYNWRDVILDEDEFERVWKEIYGKELDEDDYEIILPTKISDLKRLYPFINLRFHEVFEVESD